MEAWRDPAVLRRSEAESGDIMRSVIAAGKELKSMPLACEQDLGMLAGYRLGLESKSAMVDKRRRDRLDGYAAAVEGAWDEAARMKTPEIVARATWERNLSKALSSDIAAAESGLFGDRGASKGMFDRLAQQEDRAMAWSRFEELAARVEERRAQQESRLVSPRKAAEELGKYSPAAIAQLNAAHDNPDAQKEISALVMGNARHSAAVLVKLGNEPLPVRIAADQTPLDRVRAISGSISAAIDGAAKDERFRAAVENVDRAFKMPQVLKSIQGAAERFTGRSEAMPAARPPERDR